MELTLIIGLHCNCISRLILNFDLRIHPGGMICFGQMTIATESGELS